MNDGLMQHNEALQKFVQADRVTQYRARDMPVYDSLVYPAAGGLTELNLFAPVGGVAPYGTSMVATGQLSGQNALEVRAVSLMVDHTADPRDLAQLMRVLGSLWVNPDILMFRNHGWHMPGGGGISLNTDQGGLVAATAFTYASNGIPTFDNLRTIILESRFVILPSETFKFTNIYPISLTLQAPTTFWMYLWGPEIIPLG